MAVAVTDWLGCLSNGTTELFVTNTGMFTDWSSVVTDGATGWIGNVSTRAGEAPG
ncbi:hypothetical protein DPMN_000237 [Dreissena polymorpha]|uniref:Uncharacterized protein n=1 Tax=Dreissena polymorpha TaxID=45954 RepID=A0A9D4MF04_DREPO|nr:hypothetical protein DPMN_000237 [Dreissena polymorpha]